jgi:hypothetical protein
MAIMVHFKNNTVSFVPNHDLGELILTDSIVAFRHGNGWVDIGSGAPLQGQFGQRRYKRAERRETAAKSEVWKRIMVTELQQR